jgi:hypothetical protein
MKKPMEIISMAMGKKAPMAEDESKESSQEYDIAQDVLDAISAKDKQMLAEALEAAFMYFDSKPHVEGEHEEEME